VGSFSGSDVDFWGHTFSSLVLVGELVLFSYFITTSWVLSSFPMSDEPVSLSNSVLEIPMASVSFLFLFSAAVRGFLL